MSRFFALLRQHTVPLLIIVFALSLRIPLLSGSFWLDEAAQALESQRALSQQLNIVDDFQPPLLHYIAHFSMYAGKSEWWLRTVGALIPGLITIFFTYKIGEVIWDKKTGVIAAVLLSTSSFHIYYSQELRQYSLPAALASVSWYILLKNWKASTKPSMTDLFLLCIATSLGLYASYLYPFLIISQLVFLALFLRKQILYWLSTFVAAAVIFLPILPLFFQQLSSGSALRTDLPGWEEVVSFSQLKVLPLVFAKFLFGVLNVELSSIFVVLSVTVVIAAGAIYIFHKKTLFSKESLVIVLWLAVPIITAFLISYIVPVLQPKRVLYCLPAFYLLLAGLINVNKKSAWPFLPGLLIGIVLITNIFSTTQYWLNPRLQRENWRDLITEIEEKYPSQSAALFAFPKPFAPWVWYASASYPSFSSGTVLTDTNPDLLENIKKINEYNHVLVFEYLTDLTDPNHKLKSSLESYGYTEQGYFIYPNIGHVWIYSKPAAVISYTYK